jgi:hypothetical protein
MEARVRVTQLCCSGDKGESMIPLLGMNGAIMPLIEKKRLCVDKRSGNCVTWKKLASIKQSAETNEGIFNTDQWDQRMMKVEQNLVG